MGKAQTAQTDEDQEDSVGDELLQSSIIHILYEKA